MEKEAGWDFLASVKGLDEDVVGRFHWGIDLLDKAFIAREGDFIAVHGKGQLPISFIMNIACSIANSRAITIVGVRERPDELARRMLAIASGLPRIPILYGFPPRDEDSSLNGSAMRLSQGGVRIVGCEVLEKEDFSSTDLVLVDDFPLLRFCFGKKYIGRLLLQFRKDGVLFLACLGNNSEDNMSCGKFLGRPDTIVKVKLKRENVSRAFLEVTMQPFRSLNFPRALVRFPYDLPSGKVQFESEQFDEPVVRNGAGA